ncbi:MAG: T9SS type A sorting domain-containing protein, partial [Bacteroidia bacterium]
IWALTGRSKAYTYDSQNRNTGYLNQQLNGSIWANSGLTTITYSNNAKTEIMQNWDATNHVWINSYQETYNYDANNNLVSWLTQNWSNNTWVNNYNTNYAYNIGGKQTLGLVQKWNNNIWYNTNRIIFHYNTNNIETDHSLAIWDYNTHLLTDSEIYANTINGNNDISSVINHIWNTTTHVYDTASRYIYNYDTHHNIINSLWQNSSFSWGNPWVNVDSGAYTYNANNLQLKSVDYLWTNNNTWLKDELVSNTYDANNNALSWVRKEWNGSTWTGDSTYEYYGTVTGIQQIDHSNNLLNIYPNPNQGNFVIETNAQQQNMQIYDVKGSLVLEQIMSNKTVIDVSFLDAGVYNILINNKEGIINKKLVIVK